MGASPEILVRLLDEGVDVWRPVQAEYFRGHVHCIVDQPYEREYETWQFEPGDKVFCEITTLSDGDVLAAVSAYVPPPHACSGMEGALTDLRVPMIYLPRFREYALALEGAAALQEVNHCPWCGIRLPRSLRDEYFGLLEAMGIVDPHIGMEDAELPLEFRSDAWWKDRSIE